MTRASRSRPSSSVPSRWPAVGPSRGALSPMAVGSWRGRMPANSAARMTSNTQPAEIQNPAPRRRSTYACSAGAAPSTPAGITAAGAAVATTASVRVRSGESRTAHPRVEERVEQVDEEVHEHEASRDEHRGARYHEVIAGVDRVDGEEAEPGNLEDVLDDERATDERSHVEAADGDESEGGGSQGVAQEDPPRGQALGTRHRDEVLLQRRDHVTAQHAHINGHRAQAEGE